MKFKDLTLELFDNTEKEFGGHTHWIGFLGKIFGIKYLIVGINKTNQKKSIFHNKDCGEYHHVYKKGYIYICWGGKPYKDK